MRPSLLVVCNSLHKKSETFILNHLLLVSRHFELSVLVHHPLIEVSEKLEVKEVIWLNIPNKYISRIRMALGLLAKDFRFYVKFLNPNKFGRNATNLSLLLFAASLKDIDFDLCHAHFGNNGVLLAQLKKSGLLSAKILTTFHGLDFTARAYTPKYYRDLIKYGDKNIVVTDFSKNSLLALGFSTSTLTKIPVGTNTEFFEYSKVTKNDSVFTILFVGRLIALKGVKHLPAIAQELKEIGMDSYKICIVGEGPMGEWLQKETSDFGGRIELKGYQTQDQVKALMQKADVFLYPGIEDIEGRMENQCVTVQEASACGLPVVASHIGGLPETVVNGQSGFLVTPGNIQDFAEKINWLYRNPEERIKMGLKGREFVEEKFTFTVTDARLLQLYSTLCSQ